MQEMCFTIRPYRKEDSEELSSLVAYTLEKSNGRDYTSQYLRDIARMYSPEFFLREASKTHFYVVHDRERLIGCGGIQESTENKEASYLLSIFVLPEYQGKGIGKRIMEVLERDEYFLHSSRAELCSSITAVEFYRKQGYEFKDGISVPDGNGVIKMVKAKAGSSATTIQG